MYVRSQGNTHRAQVLILHLSIYLMKMHILLFLCYICLVVPSIFTITLYRESISKIFTCILKKKIMSRGRIFLHFFLGYFLFIFFGFSYLCHKILALKYLFLFNFLGIFFSKKKKKKKKKFSCTK